MLAPDVEIVDIDGAHWANWLELLTPPAVLDEPSWAVVFIEGRTVIKAIVAGLGAVPPGDVPFSGTSEAALDDVRKALQVEGLLLLDVATLPALMTEIESKLRIEDDITAQGLTMLRALKGVHGKGLWTAPSILDIVPVPPHDALQRTFDLMIPNGTAMVAYVLEDDKTDVHASIIAIKKDGNVDTVSTHLGISDIITGPEFARDWKRSHKRVTKAIEGRFAKPSVAVYLQKAAYYRILTGPTDQLAREVSERNVIIDPGPAWLLGLLSGAAIAGFATRGAKALSSLLPPSARKMAKDAAKRAQAASRSTGIGPFSLLGFDPIELWMRVRGYYQPRRKLGTGRD